MEGRSSVLFTQLGVLDLALFTGLLFQFRLVFQFTRAACKRFVSARKRQLTKLSFTFTLAQTVTSDLLGPESRG